MTAFTLEYDIDARIDLLAPACKLNINLDEPISSVSKLEGFATAYVAFYSNGKPLGVSVLPINGGKCLASDITSAAKGHEQQKQRVELEKLIKTDRSGIENLANTSVSVIVATCNRPDKLRLCLNGVTVQTRKPDRIIVVDNSPGKGGVEALLEEHFPEVEYLECHVRGSSATRNIGARHSDSEILAFLDDDVYPSTAWLENFCSSMSLDKRIGMSSGLVFPAALDTEAQVLMEALGGFNGGFKPRWLLPATATKNQILKHLNFHELGVGSNIIMRAAVFEQLGGFDETIGAGLGIDGEDFDFCSRVVDAGHILSFEPAAVAYHYHRETLEEFEAQYCRASWSGGYLWGRMAQYQKRLRKSANFLFRKNARLLARDAINASIGKDIVSGQFRRQKFSRYIAGYFTGRYTGKKNTLELWSDEARCSTCVADEAPVKVVQLDLCRRMPANFRCADYNAIEFQLFCGEVYLASVRVPMTDSTVNYRQVLAGIPDAAIEGILEKIKSRHPALSPVGYQNGSDLSKLSHVPFAREMCWRPSTTVVIPTKNRPDDLADCLWRISRQDYDGSLEVLVVDNDRKSGLTERVVQKFEGFIYLYCDKPGSSATRNTGFKRARGEIVIITDDDVLVPPGWVRNLVDKFRRQDVWMVNGSVLPYQLESPAETAFEALGGFAIKSEIEMTGGSFRGNRFFPMFKLGVSANMAFRRHILSNPKIGGMSEVLGAGLPTGGGEDPDLIYRVLNEGHTVITDPSIWVHHRHRRTEKGLCRQLYEYGKSGPAFFIHLMLQHKDFRVAPLLLFIQPFVLLKLIIMTETKYKKYWLAELKGYFVGFLAYFWARIRDRKAG